MSNSTETITASEFERIATVTVKGGGKAEIFVEMRPGLSYPWSVQLFGGGHYFGSPGEIVKYLQDRELITPRRAELLSAEIEGYII